MATASHPGPGGHMGHMGPASTSNVSLCPIDIDLECDGVFVREQFTWSLAEAQRRPGAPGRANDPMAVLDPLHMIADIEA